MIELQKVEPETPAIKKIHTSCKNCVFAVYNEGTITQSDCKLNRLESFKQQNTEVLEVYDAEKEFYVINGRVCNTFRDKNSKWAGKHEGKEIATVKEEIKLKMTVMVNIVNGDIEKTAESIKNQTVKPEMVLFINNQDNIKPSEIHSKLWKTLGNEVTWRITRILERNNGEHPRKERAVDVAFGQAKGTFYTLLDTGDILPSNFIESVDRALNEKLMQFVMLKPKKGIGLVVSNQVHLIIDGNAPVLRDSNAIDNIEAKVKLLAEDNEQPYLIKSVEEICPNLA